LERLRERVSISERDAVVVARDHLLVRRIRAFYEARKDRSQRRAEAQVVFAARDLEVFFCREEASELLECFGRNDQVFRVAVLSRDRYIDFGEAVAVGRDHTHSLTTKLPEHAIENRAAFLRGNGEGCVRDELLQLARFDSPALRESHDWKRRELITRQAE